MLIAYNKRDSLVCLILYLQRINYVIASFIKGWNKHPLAPDDEKPVTREGLDK